MAVNKIDAVPVPLIGATAVPAAVKEKEVVPTAVAIAAPIEISPVILKAEDPFKFLPCATFKEAGV